MSFSTCRSERPRRFSAQKLWNSSGQEALQWVSSSEAPELRYEVSFCCSLLWFRFILVCSLFSQSAGCLCISGLTLLLSLSPPICRMLRVLHQVSGRSALRLAGGHHPLLLRRGAVLRLRPRGADRHPDHAGEPLLQGHHRPRHPRHGVSRCHCTIL